MTHVLSLLSAVIAPDRVLSGDANDDYSHDESLSGRPRRPLAVVIPETTAEVSAILRVADEHRIPVTARGSGAGVSGAAIPRSDAIVVSFERMRRVDIDEANMVAVVQPGVTLTQLDAITARYSLLYPVLPGEHSASIGGNIGTNAGGSRAIKYGVTRHNVLGLELVLPGGEVLRAGGKFVKVSTGYDLTQLVIGSEGTLALVTEATLRLYPRPPLQSTVLAPFRDLADIMQAVPKLVATGIAMTTLEYIDSGSMDAISRELDVPLGVPGAVRERTLAYLAVIMEGWDPRRLEDDVAALSAHLARHGAVDVYVLPGAAGKALIDGREKLFWVAKRAGVHDLVDIVVPRASICDFMAAVATIASVRSASIHGCGHAGDGNIHLSIIKENPAERTLAMTDLYRAGLALGGAISGEHGVGTLKKEFFQSLENPAKLNLLRRIKRAFDPNGIMNPGVTFDCPEPVRP